MAKVFKVAKYEKCGCCNWETKNLYLLAADMTEAGELYHENDRGLCADCLVEMILEGDREVVYP